MEIVERRDAFEIGFRDEDSISERKREHLLDDKHRDDLVIREYLGSSPVCRRFGKVW
jgi:hypothetical protein